MQYNQFKELLLLKKSSLQYEDQGEQYYLWFEEGLTIYSCYIIKTEPRSLEQEDFEDNYKSTSNQPITQKASDSTPYVRVTEKTVGKYLQLHGFEITCLKNETTNYDIKWTIDTEFVGARAVDEKNIKGNYANLQLIDKDNILGYGAGFILHEFGKKIPSALLHNVCNVETTTAATINAGLYIRVQYVNNSEEDTIISAALKYYV